MAIVNFNDTTPAAPGGNTNVTWQHSGDNLSGYVPSSGITLEVNGTPNASQTVLNLVAGTNVTITDGGGGAITIAATGGGGASGLVLLETETAGGSTSNIPCTTRNASGQSGNTIHRLARRNDPLLPNGRSILCKTNLGVRHNLKNTIHSVYTNNPHRYIS